MYVYSDAEDEDDDNDGLLDNEDDDDDGDGIPDDEVQQIDRVFYEMQKNLHSLKQIITENKVFFNQYGLPYLDKAFSVY